MIYTPSYETYTVGQTNWTGQWPPRTSGNGVSVEGTIKQVRSHTVIDSSGQHHRYQVVVLLLSGEVRRRVFNEKGEEVDTKLHSKETLQRKGYLPAYKHVAVQDEYVISFDQLKSLIGGPGGALPAGFYDQQQGQLHPHQRNVFEFWGEPLLMKSVDLKKDVKIKLKTKNDCVFVDTIAKFDSLMPHYSGESVGQNWGEKIVAKQGGAEPVEEEDNRQGVDEEEWED